MKHTGFTCIDICTPYLFCLQHVGCCSLEPRASNLEPSYPPTRAHRNWRFVVGTWLPDVGWRQAVNCALISFAKFRKFCSKSRASGDKACEAALRQKWRLPTRQRFCMSTLPRRSSQFLTSKIQPSYIDRWFKDVQINDWLWPTSLGCLGQSDPSRSSLLLVCVSCLVRFVATNRHFTVAIDSQ